MSTEITTMTAAEILGDLARRVTAAELPRLSRRMLLGEPHPIAWATAHDLAGSRARVRALTPAQAREIARACGRLVRAMWAADRDRGCPLGQASGEATQEGAADGRRCQRACWRRADAA